MKALRVLGAGAKVAWHFFWLLVGLTILGCFIGGLVMSAIQHPGQWRHPIECYKLEQQWKQNGGPRPFSQLTLNDLELASKYKKLGCE